MSVSYINLKCHILCFLCIGLRAILPKYREDEWQLAEYLVPRIKYCKKYKSQSPDPATTCQQPVRLSLSPAPVPALAQADLKLCPLHCICITQLEIEWSGNIG